MHIDRDFMRVLVYGSAVGDALGVPYEFKARGSFACTGMVGYGTHGMPAGTWSDDTSMTIATCESILRLGRIDTQDILGNFRAWVREGRFTPFGDIFDMGITTQRAIDQGFGLTDAMSKGNGSLMRIAPLAATDCTDDEVREVSALTHATNTCKERCVDFVHLLRRVHADPAHAKEVVAELVDVAGKDRSEIGSSGYVEHTYEAAAWCFLTTDSYRDCVVEAVNLGEDTDTTACVAGALAVACCGLEMIPAGWLDALQARDQLEEVLLSGSAV